MKRIFLLCLLFVSLTVVAQHRDEKEIRAVLGKQVVAWNRGDLPGFMEGYWKSDSLMFIGSKGLEYGWQDILGNYEKAYPDTVAMGKLTFNLLHVKRLSPEYYYVVGKWHLARTKGDQGGHFNLLFRKIRGRWVIVSDHSS
ncbi:YybH family protein [Flaviaesturariibacter amylovorans]|uniref:Nuclear transport factor 2 family protein n=1 Tax=Flaviaesturariibacter amylovorans TaxID=1084520 RepID=A0ABP8HRQ1_9BACT